MKYTITIELTMHQPAGSHSVIACEAGLAGEDCWREILISIFCRQQAVFEEVFLKSLQQPAEYCMS